jgi:hypothetical protein
MLKGTVCWTIYLLVQPLLICSCSFMRPQGATFPLTLLVLLDSPKAAFKAGGSFTDNGYMQPAYGN